VWSVAPLVFILGGKWKIMVSFSCPAALPRENRTSYAVDRGLGGLERLSESCWNTEHVKLKEVDKFQYQPLVKCIYFTV
jgi:hypothetical protein